MKISIEHAMAAIRAAKFGTHITPRDVSGILDGVSGVTFASITTATRVALAAANKDVEIYKVVVANVQLFNNVTADVYLEAVKRSATKLGDDATGFVTSKPHYTHTDCYSVVHNANTDTYYLYAIYNSSHSVYVKDGAFIDKAQVAALCTPSAAKAMLAGQTTTVNIKNMVEHDVTVRTPKLSSIVSITAMKQTISV